MKPENEVIQLVRAIDRCVGDVVEVEADLRKPMYADDARIQLALSRLDKAMKELNAAARATGR